MKALPKPLKSWLRKFSGAVRGRDFASGEVLFADAVISFGTVCFRAENLDELSTRQWRKVWPRTKQFEFEYESARAIVASDLAAVMANWRSTGFDRSKATFGRRGRATIVLRKSAGGWKAVHTHFSLKPAPRHDSLFCSLSRHDQTFH